MPGITPISLEAVQPSEIDALLRLIGKFNSEEGVTPQLDQLRASLEALLKTPSLGIAWFIRCRGIPVGYTIMTFGYDLEYGGRDAWITDFYVLKTDRNKGVATEALRALEEEARRLDVHAIHLLVRETNTTARKLYSRLGFQDHPRVAMMKLL